jgi:CheY-like chemotaxis protein
VARILLIDDNDFVRETIRRVLAVSGHNVETAVDGTAGLAKFAPAAFDVVLCDLFMPGEGGTGTMRRIRDQDPRVGIIAISGGSGGTPEDLATTVDHGADLALAKPFSNRDLLDAVTLAAGLRPPAIGV